MSTLTKEWAYVELTVGSIEQYRELGISQLKEFTEEVVDIDDGVQFTLNSVVGVPKCLIDSYSEHTPKTKKENIEKCGYAHLFDYLMSEWGVPTDASDVKIVYESYNSITYSFRTRNYAPLSWIKTASSIYNYLFFDVNTSNELELWDSFECSYENGIQKSLLFHKKQRKN